MATLAIALLAAGCGFAAAYLAGDAGWGWSAAAAAGAFLAVQFAAGFFLRRKVAARMEGVQRILAAGQKRLQQKMQRWQVRPPGSIQAAQKEIETDTKAFVADALAETKKLEPFRPWVPLMGRQIATARLQLSWMVKDFKTVDALMPKAMLGDPQMRCVKMARMYMLDRPTDEIRKVYETGAKRTRYNGNVLLAATMSWIEVRRGDSDAAFKTLVAALKKSDDATLKRNHEILMNNRPAHFSNSGLGDRWYSLLLEEPRMRGPRQRVAYR